MSRDLCVGGKFFLHIWIPWPRFPIHYTTKKPRSAVSAWLIGCLVYLLIYWRTGWLVAGRLKPGAVWIRSACVSASDHAWLAKWSWMIVTLWRCLVIKRSLLTRSKLPLTWRNPFNRFTHFDSYGTRAPCVILPFPMTLSVFQDHLLIAYLFWMQLFIQLWNS